MKNELQRAFVYFLAAIVVMVSLYALFGPQGKKINLKEIDFTTSNSSRLYFKNMRSYFYAIEEKKQAKFELYRLKSSDSLFRFVIVSNWLMDESYVIAESNYKTFTLEWSNSKQTGSLEIKGETNRAHYIFAAELFEQLERKSQLWLISKDSKVKLSEEQKTSLKTSLRDYFKLVGKLR